MRPKRIDLHGAKRIRHAAKELLRKRGADLRAEAERVAKALQKQVCCPHLCWLPDHVIMHPIAVGRAITSMHDLVLVLTAMRFIW